MKYTVASRYPAGTEAVFFGIGSGKSLNADIKTVEGYISGPLAAELKRRKFKGTVGEAVTLPAPAGFAAKYVTVTGIGEEKTPDRIRRASAAVVQQLRGHKFARVALTGPAKADGAPLIGQIVEGLELADYRFDRHKSGPKEPEISVTVVVPSRQQAAVKKAVREGKVLGTAANLARDLGNEPAGILTPRELARRAKAVAARNGLTYSVMNEAQIKRAGLTAFLAVSDGSDEPAQLIRLQYRPANARKHVVLIGKSVTYDSGGINLKPSRGGGLEDMKMDMGAGGAVLAAMSALRALKSPVKVTAYLPATENMTGGHAYKPGDILKTYNGKTIEVGNTDAEGRLTLADALAYAADKDKPDEMIDLATTTATDISLGPDFAAIFSNDDRFQERVTAAGEASGERVWPLPFPDEYQEFAKSAVADFSNVVSNRMYTSSVPLLLKHFVGKTKWVHLDIGGPAMASGDRGYVKKGASGYGARLLLEYLRR